MRWGGELFLVDWNSIPLGKYYAQKHTSVKIFLLFLQKINLANYRPLRREWHTVRKKTRQHRCPFLLLQLILEKVLDIPWAFWQSGISTPLAAQFLWERISYLSQEISIKWKDELLKCIWASWLPVIIKKWFLVSARNGKAAYINPTQ